MADLPETISLAYQTRIRIKYTKPPNTNSIWKMSGHMEDYHLSKHGHLALRNGSSMMKLPLISIHLESWWVKNAAG
jgi:hypothetical protein